MSFPDGGSIPNRNTCQGADLSPPLEWLGEPAGTRGFALIMDDPDAPGNPWNHWLLFDIPSAIHQLPQGGPARGLSGRNDFGKLGYGGPCPPKGRGPHRYIFRLAALSVESLGLAAGATRAQVDQALQGKVLAEARYMGRFELQ